MKTSCQYELKVDEGAAQVDYPVRENELELSTCFSISQVMN